MTDDPILPENLAVLAAELALGLLSGPAELGALQTEREDPRFAKEVMLWRDRLASWIDGVPPQELGDSVWSRISLAVDEGKILAEEAASRSSAARKKRDDTKFWRTWALAASIGCLMLAGVSMALLLNARDHEEAGRASATNIATSQQTNFVQISGWDGTPLLSAVYNEEVGTLKLSVAAINTQDKAPELWVIDPKGKPHSLGLFGDEGDITISLSQDLRRLLVEGATMAVTLEDRAGAPHTAPEGKFVGIAKLSKI